MTASTLNHILSTIRPLLGGIPPIPPQQGGTFFTPITPFFLFYLSLTAALSIKLMKRTAAWRQTWIVLLLAACRGCYMGLRWREGDPRGFAFAVEGALLLIPGALMYYSILSLFRDAVYSYQPTSWVGRAVLKTFPRSALLVTSIHLTIVTPIPAVTWRAAARLSIQAAKWAHRLNLWSSSMGCGTMLLANFAMLVAWASRTAGLRFMPGYHYEPRKERAKLLAMHIMIASYSLAVFYRGAAFFLSERYAWLDSPGAFYTLYCLPEALCLSLHIIIPIKLTIPNPKTLLRFEIPPEERDIEEVVLAVDGRERVSISPREGAREERGSVEGEFEEANGRSATGAQRPDSARGVPH